jgi:hypothetical protein
MRNLKYSFKSKYFFEFLNLILIVLFICKLKRWVMFVHAYVLKEKIIKIQIMMFIKKLFKWNKILIV